MDEQDDVGSGVGSADADVAQLAGDAQGDAAGFVDLVVADAVVACQRCGRCSVLPSAGRCRRSRASLGVAVTGVVGGCCRCR